MSYQEVTTSIKPHLAHYAVLFPGSTMESDLSKHFLIDKNHKENHMFYTDSGLHNHFTHHYLAAYSFGASKERLQAIYDLHTTLNRSIPNSVGVLTQENYHTELGNKQAYTSFLEFFKQEIKERGMINAILKWVFLDYAMVSRFYGGATHACIHLGYAIEFNLPILAAEGLAMAACEDDTVLPFLPTPQQRQNDEEKSTTGSNGILSAETIISQVQKDPGLDNVVSFGGEKVNTGFFTNVHVQQILREYAAKWQYKDPQTSLRELFIQYMLLHSATGIRGQQTKFDFFLLHGLTSAHSLHTLMPYLTSTQAEKLLRSHLATMLIWYVRCGRPSIQIESLRNYKNPFNKKNDDNGDDTTIESNPWFDVINRGLRAQESHCIKVIRALALGQVIYRDAFKEEDGDLWLKAAQATLNAAGISPDVQVCWNYSGIGFKETWQQ